MTTKRLTLMVTVAFLLIVSVWAISARGQGNGMEKAVTVIQYKLVPVPGTMSQAQLQTVLTTQGNAGWRFMGPFAVGTGPIPDQEVLLFSRP
jgi:hypothetical protein